MKNKTRIIEKITSQEREKILSDFFNFLSSGSFINLATCSMQRMPNVAPKLVAKVEKNVIYLIDYVMGRSYSNLKENPRVSISFVDTKSFTGYQLNGVADIIEEGPEFLSLSEEFQKIKTNLTVERILLNIRTGEKGSALEFSLPEQFVILKIKIIEIVEIASSGGIKSKIAI